ncbi:MAG TPA: hypothetical protein VLJ11_16815 [Bryobacteraceae bacterium]|nr:hypothetical protein [Bryobacteraceae bacterium]
MNRFRSIYVSAVAVAGTGLIGSFFITTAQAHSWNKQQFVTATKHFIASHKLLRPNKAAQPPTTGQ